MARVSLDNDYPQIARPVGSSEEVKALDVPLRNVATCCAHVDGKDGAMGCPRYSEQCDREYRGTRPRMEVMKVITKEGGIRVYHAPCFDNVGREIELEAQGGYAEVIGQEGDTYLSRGSVKRHIKRDPDCPDCARNDCNIWDDKDDIPQECPPFPKAEEHEELKKFANIKKARERGHIVKRSQQAERLLSDHDTENAKVVRRAEKPKPS